MATRRRPWTRTELLVALGLYLRVPFGQISQRNPEIIGHAELLERSPAALSMKMGNLASLDDSLKRSGLRNASQADRDVWAELQADWSATAIAIAEANESIGAKTLEHDEEQDVALGEDVIAESNVRHGQALFRATVLSAYQSRCCITGLEEPQLLVASHIVPWAADRNRRLDPRNGLCLNVLHDRAFDRGLITFDEHVRLLVSPALKDTSNDYLRQNFLELGGRPLRLPEKFAPVPTALAYHRDHIFVQ